LWYFIVISVYIILLTKLRLDQISCSGRSGTRWQYEVPEWYEIVKMLGTPVLEESREAAKCV